MTNKAWISDLLVASGIGIAQRKMIDRTWEIGNWIHAII